MGIEATFWKKPSLVAGITNYEHLNANYKVHSHEELLDLLQKDLKPKDQLGAFIYGYYYKTFGTPFKTYKAESVGYGEWKGENIHANYATSRERNLRRFLKLPGMGLFKNKIDKIAYEKAKSKFFN